MYEDVVYFTMIKALKRAFPEKADNPGELGGLATEIITDLRLAGIQFHKATEAKTPTGLKG